MSSRRLLGACMVVLTGCAFGGVAGATSAPQRVGSATTTQPQSGSAVADESFDVYLLQQVEDGTYSTHGQLGSGRFRIETTYDDSHCVPSGSISLTGTATLTRSDGASLKGTATGTEGCAAGNTQPESWTLALGSGTRDLVSANLTLTGTRTFVNINPGGDDNTAALILTGSATFTHPIGYWMVGANGTVTGFGGLAAMGNAPTTGVTHLEPTPDLGGYWIVDSAGHVFAFGDATWLGNASTAVLAANETVTNLSATPSGKGYWLFTTRGRALRFGDATFFGDMHAVALNGPVIGATATPTGLGYYMVASDGGVFAFGDATFRGSMGAVPLNRPVNALVPTADNSGYWLVASDGGVFAFDAPFLGSMGAKPLNQPVIGMARYGTGYLMVASDGGIFNFSDGVFFGSLGGSSLTYPVVGVAATR